MRLEELEQRINRAKASGHEIEAARLKLQRKIAQIKQKNLAKELQAKKVETARKKTQQKITKLRQKQPSIGGILGIGEMRQEQRKSTGITRRQTRGLGQVAQRSARMTRQTGQQAGISNPLQASQSTFRESIREQAKSQKFKKDMQSALSASDKLVSSTGQLAGGIASAAGASQQFVSGMRAAFQATQATLQSISSFASGNIIGGITSLLSAGSSVAQGLSSPSGGAGGAGGTSQRRRDRKIAEKIGEEVAKNLEEQQRDVTVVNLDRRDQRNPAEGVADALEGDRDMQRRLNDVLGA
jgi:myosin heavy subunit